MFRYPTALISTQRLRGSENDNGKHLFCNKKSSLPLLFSEPLSLCVAKLFIRLMSTNRLLIQTATDPRVTYRLQIVGSRSE